MISVWIFTVSELDSDHWVLLSLCHSSEKQNNARGKKWACEIQLNGLRDVVYLSIFCWSFLPREPSSLRYCKSIKATTMKSGWYIVPPKMILFAYAAWDDDVIWRRNYVIISKQRSFCFHHLEFLDFSNTSEIYQKWLKSNQKQ